MERTKKARKILRSAITRNCNLVVQHLNEKQLVDARSAFAVIERDWEALQEADSRILELMLDEELADETYEEEKLQTEEYGKKVESVRIKLADIESNKNTESCSESLNCVGHSLKLPPIKIEPFDGELKNWLLFWGQFEPIHLDESIATFHKFRILKQSMKPGSRAQQVVDSFPITKDCNNYNVVVDTLKERFGREHLLIDFYTRDLLQTIIKNAKAPHFKLFDVYDKLECQLRFLELLGLTSGKCAAIICPMLESCMPEDFLRAWQRSGLCDDTGDAEQRLSRFRAFIKSEVQNEQRIALAVDKFGMTDDVKCAKGARKSEHVTKQNTVPPSAADLITTNKQKVCIFCQGSHQSTECFKARRMPLDEKLQCVRDKQCCYLCLIPNHASKRCKLRSTCMICDKKHALILCPNYKRLNQEKPQKSSDTDTKMKNEKEPQITKKNVAANTTSCDSSVMVCTIKLKLTGPGGEECLVRAAIDTCAQRSYITDSTASALNCKLIKKETLFHSLFQDRKTGKSVHNKYEVQLKDLNETFVDCIEALGTEVICGTLPTIPNGPWIEEMEDCGIDVSKVLDDSGPVDLLIGGDYAGKFLTGRAERFADGSITGLETKFGWTFMGKIPTDCYDNTTSMLTTTLLISEMNVADLWRLDLIGIEDPSQRKTKTELQDGVFRNFLETVTVNEEGRYEVNMPWKEEHPPLPTNYDMALKRLASTEKKLENDGLKGEYYNVFQEWLEEGVIEEVPISEPKDDGHYLPHRHVVKLNSTTKIRPVFDASAHERNSPSLNQCLEKGCNLVELIPNLLHRFRLHKIGVVADIRRAFLQISISPEDRKFFKFLWRKPDGSLTVYQHRRVVFGCTSSPFLLGAVIQYHLQNKMKEIEDGKSEFSRITVETLKQSFYVDNVVASFDSPSEIEMFVKESKAIMAQAKFDLRGWEQSDQAMNSSSVTSVLGLQWDQNDDTLSISDESLKITKDVITKRVIASAAHKVFDPLGFASPVTLEPKFLLKELWGLKIGWDEVVPQHIESRFSKWLEELSCLKNVKIPRWCSGTTNPKHISLHVFTDASESSYGAVIFLRVEEEYSGNVQVQLVQSKSKISPTKKITIPRLELLAANIGARLYDSIREHFGEDTEVHFWTDSSTVLAWLKRPLNWGQFVSNRVNEIKRLTHLEQWQHVPGTMNPADLPSRGCLGRALVESRWWEGPQWLYNPIEHWPKSNCDYDEDVIAKEKKKTVVSSMLTLDQNKKNDWYYRYFSNYEKLIRMVAWMVRFSNNCQHNSTQHIERKDGSLRVEEIEDAELRVLKLVQRESFSGPKDGKISSLKPFEDQDGILRLKTSISNRQDSVDFRYPIVLPKDHPVVLRLLRSIHEKHCHVGVQGMLAITRERFWVIGGRRTMKSVTAHCVVCKRFESKRLEAPTPSLSIDRVREASAFEVTGVDLAGPLYLKGGKKAWICLFTCGVIRAVHLELLQSLSTDDFLMGLRRFVARRGRPKKIYSDQGTNFTGTNNLFQKIKWNDVSQYCGVNRIIWKFNPATASWWGGWWERIVGLTKRLLRKVLKRSSLTYVEMETTLCDCESVLNARPLTYVTDGDNEPIAITPSMFIQDLKEAGMPELDIIESTNFSKKLQHCTKLKQDLRSRFRNEYLGLLRCRCKNSAGNVVKLNDIVLIGNDNSKRLDWPMGKVIELISGKDNIVRLVRLKTSYGECVRPIQRLYRILEADDNQTSEPIRNKTKVTSRGRTVTLPKRFCV